MDQGSPGSHGGSGDSGGHGDACSSRSHGSAGDSSGCHGLMASVALAWPLQPEAHSPPKKNSLGENMAVQARMGSRGLSGGVGTGGLDGISGVEGDEGGLNGTSSDEGDEGELDSGVKMAWLVTAGWFD